MRLGLRPGHGIGQHVVVSSSWIEWLACAMVALSAVLAFGRFRLWGTLGFVMVMAAWAAGTAGGLLLPVAFGSLAVMAFSGLDLYWQMTGRCTAAAGAILSAILCALFPMPHPHALPGPYAVSTGTFQVAPGGDAKPLVVQVWYPAHAGDATSARWLPDPELATSFLFHRLAYAPSRSMNGAPLLEKNGAWPVIFYEHSWMGHRSENIVQVEDLASHGFVVIAIDHPEQCARVRRADGSIGYGKLPSIPDLSTPEAVAAFEKSARPLLVQRHWDIRQTRQWLDRGEVHTLAGRLDLEHLGAFGFSFGGTSALYLCSHDPAFKTGVNEDGFVLGDMQPTVPFLFFDDELPTWLKRPAAAGENAEQTLQRESDSRIQEAVKRSGSERHILDGARHESFTDRIYLSRIPKLAKAGNHSADEMRELVNVPLANFFKHHLTSLEAISTP